MRSVFTDAHEIPEAEAGISTVSVVLHETGAPAADAETGLRANVRVLLLGVGEAQLETFLGAHHGVEALPLADAPSDDLGREIAAAAYDWHPGPFWDCDEVRPQFTTSALATLLRERPDAFAVTSPHGTRPLRCVLDALANHMRIATGEGTRPSASMSDFHALVDMNPLVEVARLLVPHVRDDQMLTQDCIADFYFRDMGLNDPAFVRQIVEEYREAGKIRFNHATADPRAWKHGSTLVRVVPALLGRQADHLFATLTRVEGAFDARDYPGFTCENDEERAVVAEFLSRAQEQRIVQKTVGQMLGWQLYKRDMS